MAGKQTPPEKDLVLKLEERKKEKGIEQGPGGQLLAADERRRFPPCHARAHGQNHRHYQGWHRRGSIFTKAALFFFALPRPPTTPPLSSHLLPSPSTQTIIMES
jgi:hypothetical protein